MENNQELICFSNYQKWRECVDMAHLAIGWDRHWYCQKALFHQAQAVMAHALEGKNENH